jgi:1-phosphofructokinase family hexose kinase
MIYTVTLNPALDLELCVPEILFDQVLRASQVRVDNGGKGFNISRALSMLGVPNMALGFLGGKTGERMAIELETLGVQTDVDWIPGETRTNVHIVDLHNGHYIKVNQPGPHVTAVELKKLLVKVRSKARPGDMWIFSGSLPPGAVADSYAPMVKVVQGAGGIALIDADGDTLLETCRARPYLVKPNALEAGELTGLDIARPEDALRAAATFHGMGVWAVLITLGVDGAVLSLDGHSWWAKPPAIDADIPTGAGDATMAGFIWGLSQGAPLDEALRLGVASGTASASLPGTAVAGPELIEEIAAQVRITDLA